MKERFIEDVYPSKEDVTKVLFPLSCRYCFVIEDDGKCYSDKCMMNTVELLKLKIEKNGCGCFNMLEVQDLLEEGK